ncbi:hypothetical protein [Haloferax sulfurifontis]|uniref:Uncharacterized protein n=2 Tax=Haloferax sulfurifontis TaxID=255616 RepID=M0IKR0_9EURY|nr:hypothetical protein [Haloferax sulfurifontis]ELZ96622.1 hypothetical protein C441_04619 [Haloferax sulfurifontis ATCC BAA-897]GGC72391.1 hypothetical protein GCM10007209_37890 [Haloferax sulfurifontis]
MTSQDNDSPFAFFDEDGGWVTMTTLKNEMGPFETSARETVESLEAAGIVNVRRGDDGRPVTVQLSAFADDLVNAESDAEALEVYRAHDKEPPDNLRE